jgi:hypothetical protein
VDHIEPGESCSDDYEVECVACFGHTTPPRMK